MGAKQSRTLTFPAGSVETQPFSHHYVGDYYYRKTVMITPDLHVWLIGKWDTRWRRSDYERWNTLGYHISNVVVKDANTIILVSDYAKRSDGATFTQKEGLQYTIVSKNEYMDKDGHIFELLKEPLANPLKHPFLNILNEFLVKKEEPVKVEV